MKRVAVIGTVGLPAKYGGFETLTKYLVKEKGDDFVFMVYCSKKAYPEGQVVHEKAILKYIPLNANGIQSIPYDIWGILHGLRKCDSLLVLGVSGCIILPLVKIFSKKKITVNIDGLEWKRAKWGKWAKKYLKFSEKLAVKNADSVVADNAVIKDYVSLSYNKIAHHIAYGGDHSKREKITENTIKEFSFLKENYAIKVCRIEPENNVELILKAFAQYSKINLVVIGNWENSEYSKNLRRRFENENNLFLLDPIYDQEKLNQLRSNCYLYVHGHSAGGTNPSLVEAMSLGLPVLAYGVNYNRETTENKALYFEDEISLITVLENLKKDQLLDIGKNMELIAQNRYTWAHVANQYEEIF